MKLCKFMVEMGFACLTVYIIISQLEKIERQQMRIDSLERKHERLKSSSENLRKICMGDL